ncbi:prepilin-type N-terminal cleavage/methylation domain-containing protein [Paucibacter sp. O1-1]|nr:prepilin-type N-terminal cleavage/methylation domain-containing protein [Paucibacter sp. O1-1]MDA3831336.1 prepilin-type N-terminal cleavage/methylation domain-containing protein [Paucibacter sp. O1-1]
MADESLAIAVESEGTFMRNKLQCQPTLPFFFLFSLFFSLRRIKGFTLIELVIGMMVIAVAIVMLTSMLFPKQIKHRLRYGKLRSAELAHSVMNEIWGKRYDQNTNANGGVPSCNASAGLTCSTSMGNDGESRDAFNDVDDYTG